MDQPKHAHAHAHAFLLFCLVASLAIVVLMLEPFLTPVIFAAMLAFFFYPLYRMLLGSEGRRLHPSLAAFVTTVVAMLLLVLPVGVVGVLILKAATGLYQPLVNDGRNDLISFIEEGESFFRTVVPVAENFQLDIRAYAREGLATLIANLGTLFSNVAHFLLNIFVFLITFYFLLKDGSKLRDYMLALSPLSSRDNDMILSRLERAVSVTINGNLVLGLIQGVLAGIGFAVFGVPNPILWGSVTAIASLVPGVGTALIVAPGVIFLFMTGNIIGGLGLLVWGITIVGLADNVLLPKFVGEGMQLHPLTIFLAVLGGTLFFGPLGFALGPLAMSLSLALVDIYFSLKAQTCRPAKKS